jgi:hypothetical protein
VVFILDCLSLGGFTERMNNERHLLMGVAAMDAARWFVSVLNPPWV